MRVEVLLWGAGLHNYQDIGEYLVTNRLLAQDAWDRVLEVQEEARHGLVPTITGLGLMSEQSLSETLSLYSNVSLAGDNDWPVDKLELPGLNTSFLSAHYVVPVRFEGDTLVAITADPTNEFVVEALSFATGYNVELKVSSLRKVEAVINSLYLGLTEGALDEVGIGSFADDIDRIKELAADAPVIRFVDRLIDDALTRNASDIHVEPVERALQIRFRIDGILVNVPGPSQDISAAIVSRLKIISGLDIAERRLPQDGRMRIRAHGKEVDFRVATSPSAQGESVVMRLLDREAVELDFNKLGFDADTTLLFRSALHSPDGIVLVTGPTGSGKTTTLYTGLSELNTLERKIVTVEDPVEYVLSGLGQVQVDNKVGRTFAKALRSFLRQDPDVIMVGEIRDGETATIAVQASLTGHLVLSTLHTNSASAAIARLLDMGVEEYLLASTVRLVIAQRLVRTLCKKCKVQVDHDPSFLEELGVKHSDGIFYDPAGCSECNDTGYAGRTVITEVLKIDKDLERAVLDKRTGAEIEALAMSRGMKTLFQHGLEKAQTGTTSIQEVLRVTRATIS